MSSRPSGQRLETWLEGVPAEDRQRLENALEAGERIRWAVRPRPQPPLRRRELPSLVITLLVLLLFGAALGGLLSLMLTRELEQAAYYFLGVVVLFLLLLCFLILRERLRTHRERQLAPRCFYVLTNRRALVHEVKGVSAYDYRRARRDIQRDADGVGGDIIWDYLPLGRHGLLPLGFLHLPELSEALAQLQAAAAEDENTPASAAEPPRPSLSPLSSACLPPLPASLHVQLAENMGRGERLLRVGRPRPYWVGSAGPAGLAHWLLPIGLGLIGCCCEAGGRKNAFDIALLLTLAILLSYLQCYSRSKRWLYALGEQHLILCYELGKGQYELRRMVLAGCRYRVKPRLLGGGADITLTQTDGDGEESLRNLPDAAEVETLLQQLGVEKDR